MARASPLRQSAGEQEIKISLAGFRVVAVAIPFPDLAIAAMDEQFASPVDGHFTADSGGGGLGRGNDGRALGAGRDDGPAVRAGRDMQILSHEVVCVSRVRSYRKSTPSQTTVHEVGAYKKVATFAD